MYNILVIDDEKDIADMIADILEDEGYKVKKAANSDEAFISMDHKLPDVIILDIWLQKSKLDGLEILQKVKKNYPNLPIIMISGHGNIETAVNSIKMVAYDYIEKPFNEEKFTRMVERACEINKLYNENNKLEAQVNDLPIFVAGSQIIQDLLPNIEKISPTSSRILISGEVGTGKFTIAKSIHGKSQRAEKNFLRFSPSGLSEIEIETSLFGGSEILDIIAVPRVKGMLELAADGTIYIDEVADLPLIIQQKLLNFILRNNYEIAGSRRLIQADVRIITGTKYNLEEKIKKGEFNSDLYFRLKVFFIEVPPLRMRKPDILILCKLYLKYISKNDNYEFSDEAITGLQFYSWPGNIRELVNFMERLYINMKSKLSKKIDFSCLPVEVQNNTIKIDTALNNIEILNYNLKDAKELFERQYISAQLQLFEGNVSKASEKIGMERTALYRKLKSLNIMIFDIISEK